jgi:hypothetical protein
MLLNTSRESIANALRSYSAGHRLLGAGEARTWFIEDPEGRLLPLKHIIGLATGIPTKGFNTSDAISTAKSLGFSTVFTGEELVFDLEAVRHDSTRNATVIEQLIFARLGQGKFRKALIKEQPTCYVTKFADDRLLVASHIKPWRESSDEERLDPKNGLLLVPQLDRAFDLGMISFSKDGKILISSSFLHPERLGVLRQMKLSRLVGREGYLDYHRCKVLK